MRKLVIATMVFVLAGNSATYARGGMHGSGMHGLMAPRESNRPTVADPRSSPHRGRAASTPPSANIGRCFFAAERDAQT